MKKFLVNTSGATAVEVALVLPIMMTLLLGMADVGNALLINTKTNSAAQIVADLLTRHATATTADITDAWSAARMAIDPYSRARFGIDIVSIQYQNANATPVILWRQTYNMTANPNVLTLAAGLGVQGEGILMVTSHYDYRPVFSNLIVGNSTMQEVAIARPRRGSVVARQ